MKFSNHLPPKILILLFLIFPFVIGGKERGSPRSVLERKALATKYVRIILASNAPPFHLEKLEKDYPIQKTQKGQDDHISTGLLNHGSHSNRKRQRQSEPDENIKKPKASVDNEQWIIKSASGGLVTAVEPVIKANKENVWVFHVTRKYLLKNYKIPSKNMGNSLVPTLFFPDFICSIISLFHLLLESTKL
ncbi:unnamed protein product [Meloidogyne enterolobii]|uniref:Uncharacterized protein n=1 Tax=Meloidogyne enterolobii TaxID=390850 RepID=A0ACB1B1L0_MELEN